MAILIEGKTICPICGKVVQKGAQAVLFPHFVLNEADPLYPLSDAACHVVCAKNDSLGTLMLAASELCISKTGPGKRICAVCGQEVRDPGDYLLIGYLADPANDPIGKFNYTHLHKAHIRQWEDAEEFLTLAKAVQAKGNWRGAALTEIVREIEQQR